MSGPARQPDPADRTQIDFTPEPLAGGLPSSAGGVDVTMPDIGNAGSPADFPTLRADATMGAFTTTLAATYLQKIEVTIPASFLAAGTPGSLLRLVPVEMLRGGPPLELYLKTGNVFTLGRSPEVDWITAFFPRNEKNDLRSKRLSKQHAWIEYRDGQLWVHRWGGAEVHIGAREVGTDPGGALLRESDRLLLSEDYALQIYYDISLQNTLRFANGEAWQGGPLAFGPGVLGAVRLEPLNSALALRSACWLFVDVGFGSARGGVLTAGSELAPQQGAFLNLGGVFWMLNLVDNGKISVNDYVLPAQQMVPFSHGDAIWLGAVRYRAEITDRPSPAMTA
jgi:hypothetical protein